MTLRKRNFQMSEKLKNNMAAISLFAALVLGPVGTWAVIQHRVSQTEEEIRGIKEDRKKDHEILVRIDERVNRLLERRRE